MKLIGVGDVGKFWCSGRVDEGDWPNTSNVILVSGVASRNFIALVEIPCREKTGAGATDAAGFRFEAVVPDVADASGLKGKDLFVHDRACVGAVSWGVGGVFGNGESM